MKDRPTDVTDLIRQRVKPAQYESLGRMIRQSNAELTARNAPFHHYLFANNLYNVDGLIETFQRNAQNLQQRALA